MRWLLRFFTSSAILLLTLAAQGSEPADTTVSFHKDVLPIIRDHCEPCHSEGGIGPMALTSYEDVHKWAEPIRKAVLSRSMPPWHADRSVGHFQNDRSLSASQINTISDWVANGSLEGEPFKSSTHPPINREWTLGTPDLVIHPPSAVTISKTGVMDYVYIAVPTGLTADTWATGFQVLPGDRSVIHHMTLFIRPPGSAMWADTQPGMICAQASPAFRATKQTSKGQVFDAIGPDLEMLGVYVPGGNPVFLPPGHARLIRAGSELIFQIHYVPNGHETADLSKVGLYFTSTKPTYRVVSIGVLNRSIIIPPFARRHIVEASVKFDRPVTILDICPHMHYRGKSFVVKITEPRKSSEVLLNVPRFSPFWQTTYVLSQPKTLAKDSTIKCVATFDNSRENALNPDPSKEVRWGDQATDEMMVGFVDVAIPSGADPVKLFRPSKGISD